MRWLQVPLAVLLLALVAAVASADGKVHVDAASVVPLEPGARVPAVSVLGVDGAAQDLPSLVAEAGALLVFYRGGW